MNSETNYISNLRSMSMIFSNVTFSRVRYSDQLRSNSFIVRYDEYLLSSTLSYNSTFSDLSMFECETNFMMFKGFSNRSITNNTQLFVMEFLRLSMISNRFYKESSILLFGS